MLRQVNFHERTERKVSITCILSVVLLLTLMPASTLTPDDASAQITPTSGLGSSDPEIALITQNMTDPLPNATISNITQLATIASPLFEQPITPASTTAPTNEGTDDDDTDSSDEEDTNSNDSDEDDDSDGDDDDDDGGGNSGNIAVSGGGGAFASAG